MSPAPEGNNLCVFNGINGATGKYLTPPMDPKDLFKATMGRYADKKLKADADTLAQIISGGRAGRRHLDELKARRDAAEPSFGVRPGIDAGKLEEAGWGLILL
jgi:hypothetical protein